MSGGTLPTMICAYSWSLWQIRLLTHVLRFVSDCMGQPPTIAEGAYTTRLPADVDEDAFDPRSMLLPIPGVLAAVVEADGSTSQPEDDAWHENGFKYFELKCRCVLFESLLKIRLCSSSFLR